MEKAISHKYKIDSWEKKFFSSKLFWLVFVLLAFSYPVYRSIYRELPPELPILYKVPDFKFTNQYNRSFGSDDLKGKVYLASFSFTSCPTVCPGLMKRVRTVQKRIRGVGNKMALVTFTVDPETDTPNVLKKYAQDLQVNSNIWNFLTGPEDELRKIVVDGFKVPMGEKEKYDGYKVGDKEVSLFDIAHTEKLVLVDQVGRVRGYYSTDKNSLDRLMIDTGLIINRPVTN